MWKITLFPVLVSSFFISVLRCRGYSVRRTFVLHFIVDVLEVFSLNMNNKYSTELLWLLKKERDWKMYEGFLLCCLIKSKLSPLVDLLFFLLHKISKPNHRFILHLINQMLTKIDSIKHLISFINPRLLSSFENRIC